MANQRFLNLTSPKKISTRVLASYLQKVSHDQFMILHVIILSSSKVLCDCNVLKVLSDDLTGGNGRYTRMSKLIS